MAQFRTICDERKRFICRSGSPVKPIYGLEIDKKGVWNLVEKGKQNFYEYINSFKDSVDLNIIRTKFLKGDTSVLNHRNVFYGDFSQMPSNIYEFYNLASNAEAFFNTLPLEVKEKFNNSYTQFLASVSENGLDSVLDSIAQPVQKPVENADIIKGVGDINE